MKRHKVLLVNPYGSLADESWVTYRTQLLMNALKQSEDVDVTWMVANHDVRTKKEREQSASEDYVFIKVRPYKSSVGIGRLLFEAMFYIRVLFSVRFWTADSLILISPAMLFGSCLAVCSRIKKTTVFVDFLDLWPEHFDTRFSGVLYGLVRKFLISERGFFLSNVHHVFFCSRSYQCLHPNVASSSINYIGTQQEVVLKKRAKDSAFTILYAGTFGDTYDMECMHEAILLLAEASPRYRFVLAGSGPMAARFEELGARLQTVEYLGLVEAADLPEIYASAHVGLMPYSAGSRVAMPLKFFDYTRAGLRIVTSLNGEVRDILEQFGIGSIYKAGDPQSFALAVERACFAAETNVLSGEMLETQYDANWQATEIAKTVLEFEPH